jgi:DNA-directed RNA polymerase subunit omega
MMIEPPIDDVLKNTDSCFTLVSQSAKRARQLIHGAECTAECDSKKPISMATHEICKGTISYRRLRD